MTRIVQVDIPCSLPKRFKGGLLVLAWCFSALTIVSNSDWITTSQLAYLLNHNGGTRNRTP